MSTPALFVAVYRILSCCYCFINFSFSLPSLRLSRLVFGRFPLFSFRRFINRCFASSFLTTVGWILLIESKPFDFAVSTPALFVAWSIAFLVVTASSTFAFLCYLFFVCRIRRLIDFCFLSFRGFINQLFCFVFLNNHWLNVINCVRSFRFRSVYTIVICRLIY